MGFISDRLYRGSFAAWTTATKSSSAMRTAGLRGFPGFRFPDATPRLAGGVRPDWISIAFKGACSATVMFALRLIPWTHHPPVTITFLVPR